MKTSPVTPADLQGVFAVPPLARRPDAARSLDLEQNDRLVRHVADGGITRFLYGGNAFLYHITVRDYKTLLEWLAGYDDQLWMIPSAGPSFGRTGTRLAGVVRYSGDETAPVSEGRT